MELSTVLSVVQCNILTNNTLESFIVNLFNCTQHCHLLYSYMYVSKQSTNLIISIFRLFTDTWYTIQNRLQMYKWTYHHNIVSDAQTFHSLHVKIMNPQF